MERDADFIRRCDGQSDDALRTSLEGKLLHIRERIENPPDIIVHHVKLFAQCRLRIFESTSVMDTLLGFVRVLMGSKPMASRATLLSVSLDIIYRLYSPKADWPVELFELYLDDALGHRAWVDSKDPPVAIFVHNLVHWSEIQHLPPANARPDTVAQVLFDDSDNDEVIVIESHDLGIEPPVVHIAYDHVCDRFAKSRHVMKDKVMRMLSVRCGIAYGDLDESHIKTLSASHPVTNFANVIQTIITFCHLSDVRSDIACIVLQRILSNPARVEQARGLALRIAGCLQENDNHIDANTAGDFSDDNGSLISSDLVVLEKVIKLRWQLKAASHIEWHKQVILSTSQRSPSLAKFVLISLIIDDAEACIFRSETIKLVVLVLQSLGNTSHDRSLPTANKRWAQQLSTTIKHEIEFGDRFGEVGAILSQVQEYIAHAKPSRLAVMFGMVVGEVCGKLVESGFVTHWQSAQFKLLEDNFLKIMHLLSIGGIDTLWYLVHILSSFALSTRGVMQGTQNTDEIVSLIGNICVHVQLLLVNEALVRERENRDKQLHQSSGLGRMIDSGNSGGSSNNSSGNAPLAGLSGAGFGGGGFGSVRSGKFRERGVHDNVQSAVRGSSNLYSGASKLRGAAPPTVGERIGVLPGSGSKRTSREKISAVLCCMKVHWLCIRWVRNLLESASIECGWFGKLPLSASATASVVNSTINGQILTTKNYGMDWLMLVLGFQVPYLSRTLGDMDKAAPFFLRDNILVNSYQLLDLIALIKIAGSNSRDPESLIADLCLVDGLCQRAHRIDFMGQSGICVDNVQVLDNLLALGQINLIPQTLSSGLQRGVRYRCCTFAEQEAGASKCWPVVPLLSHTKVYWKVCEISYFLGCARPDILGKHLWFSNPTVRNLMMLSICNSFDKAKPNNEQDSAPSVAGSSLNSETISALATKFYNADTHRELCALISEPLPCFLSMDYAACLLVDNIGKADGEQLNVYAREFRLRQLEKSIWAFLFGENPDRALSLPIESSENPLKRKFGEDSVASLRSKASRKGQFLKDYEDIITERENAKLRYNANRDARALRAQARASRQNIFDGHATQSSLALSDMGSSNPAHIQGYDSNSATIEVASQDNTETQLNPDSVEEHSRMVEVSEVVELSDSDLDAQERKRLRVEPEIFQSTPADVEVKDVPGAADPTDSDVCIVGKSEVLVSWQLIPVTLGELYPLWNYDSPLPFSTQFGNIGDEDIIISNCTNWHRLPPASTVSIVHALDIKYQFGETLRSSANPDFILFALVDNVVDESNANGHSLESSDDRKLSQPFMLVRRECIESSFGWLCQAISVDVDAILRRIPTVAILHLSHILSSRLFDLVAKSHILGLELDEQTASTTLISRLVALPIVAAEFDSLLGLLLSCVKKIANFMLSGGFHDYSNASVEQPVLNYCIALLQLLLSELSSENEQSRRSCRFLLAVMSLFGESPDDWNAAQEKSQLKHSVIQLLVDRTETGRFISFFQSKLCRAVCNWIFIVRNAITSAVYLETKISIVQQYFDFLLDLGSMVNSDNCKPSAIDSSLLVVSLIIGLIDSRPAIGQKFVESLHPAKLARYFEPLLACLLSNSAGALIPIFKYSVELAEMPAIFSDPDKDSPYVSKLISDIADDYVSIGKLYAHSVERTSPVKISTMALNGLVLVASVLAKSVPKNDHLKLCPIDPSLDLTEGYLKLSARERIFQATMVLSKSFDDSISAFLAEKLKRPFKLLVHIRNSSLAEIFMTGVPLSWFAMLFRECIRNNCSDAVLGNVILRLDSYHAVCSNYASLVEDLVGDGITLFSVREKLDLWAKRQPFCSTKVSSPFVKFVLSSVYFDSSGISNLVVKPPEVIELLDDSPRQERTFGFGRYSDLGSIIKSSCRGLRDEEFPFKKSLGVLATHLIDGTYFESSEYLQSIILAYQLPSIVSVVGEMLTGSVFDNLDGAHNRPILKLIEVILSFVVWFKPSPASAIKSSWLIRLLLTAVDSAAKVLGSESRIILIQALFRDNISFGRNVDFAAVMEMWLCFSTLWDATASLFSQFDCQKGELESFMYMSKTLLSLVEGYSDSSDGTNSDGNLFVSSKSLVISFQFLCLLRFVKRLVTGYLTMVRCQQTPNAQSKDNILTMITHFVKVVTKIAVTLASDPTSSLPSDSRDVGSNRTYNNFGSMIAQVLNLTEMYCILYGLRCSLMTLVSSDLCFAVAWAQACSEDSFAFPGKWAMFPDSGARVAKFLVPVVLSAAYRAFPMEINATLEMVICRWLSADAWQSIDESRRCVMQATYRGVIVYNQVLGQECTARCILVRNSMVDLDLDDSVTLVQREDESFAKFKQDDIILASPMVSVSSDIYLLHGQTLCHHEAQVSTDITVATEFVADICQLGIHSLVEKNTFGFESNVSNSCAFDVLLTDYLRALTIAKKGKIGPIELPSSSIGAWRIVADSPENLDIGRDGNGLFGLAQYQPSSWLQAINGPRLEIDSIVGSQPSLPGSKPVHWKTEETSKYEKMHAGERRVDKVNYATVPAIVCACQQLILLATEHPALFVRIIPEFLRQLRLSFANLPPAGGASRAWQDSGIVSEQSTTHRVLITLPASLPWGYSSRIPAVAGSAGLTGNVWKVSFASPSASWIVNEPLCITATLCLRALPEAIWLYQDTNIGLQELYDELYKHFYRRQRYASWSGESALDEFIVNELEKLR